MEHITSKSFYPEPLTFPIKRNFLHRLEDLIRKIFGQKVLQKISKIAFTEKKYFANKKNVGLEDLKTFFSAKIFRFSWTQYQKLLDNFSYSPDSFHFLLEHLGTHLQKEVNPQEVLTYLKQKVLGLREDVILKLKVLPEKTKNELCDSFFSDLKEKKMTTDSAEDFLCRLRVFYPEFNAYFEESSNPNPEAKKILLSVLCYGHLVTDNLTKMQKNQDEPEKQYISLKSNHWKKIQEWFQKDFLEAKVLFTLLVEKLTKIYPNQNIKPSLYQKVLDLDFKRYLLGDAPAKLIEDFLLLSEEEQNLAKKLAVIEMMGIFREGKKENRRQTGVLDGMLDGALNLGSMAFGNGIGSRDLVPSFDEGASSFDFYRYVQVDTFFKIIEEKKNVNDTKERAKQIHDTYQEALLPLYGMDDKFFSSLTNDDKKGAARLFLLLNWFKTDLIRKPLKDAIWELSKEDRNRLLLEFTYTGLEKTSAISFNQFQNLLSLILDSKQLKQRLKFLLTLFQKIRKELPKESEGGIALVQVQELIQYLSINSFNFDTELNSWVIEKDSMKLTRKA